MGWLCGTCFGCGTINEDEPCPDCDEYKAPKDQYDDGDRAYDAWSDEQCEKRSMEG